MTEPTVPQVPMTPEEFKKEMEKTFPTANGRPMYDEEGAHGYADGVMCDLLRSLGYGEGVDVFDNAEKWYS